MAKRLSICWSFTPCKRRGPRGNVALFCNALSSNWGFQHCARRAHCKSIACKWHCKIGHFSDGNQAPIVVRLLFSCTAGERATLTFCTSIGAYNALLWLCISCLLQPTHFLTMGIFAFTDRREAHYGVLLVDISSLPFIQTIPLGWAIFG